MPKKLQTAVVGATGYAGFELARLLLRHSRLAPPLLLRRDAENGPTDLSEIYPQISGNGRHPLEAFSWGRLQRSSVDLLFLATPHEISREWVPEAITRGLRVIDLSGAWRLKQAAHRAVYGFTEGNGLDEKAVYGLPELNRSSIASAQLVANPGCYATSVILALAPLVQAGAADAAHGIVCDSKSGVSGAGKQPTQKTHFVEVADNLSAYAVFAHRHTGEILEQLRIPAEQLTFTPHLLPIPRGILSTMYLRLKKRSEAAELEQCLRDFYAGSPWVRVMPAPRLPQIQYSVRTNFCDIGVCVSQEGRRAVVVSCLDNLLKGAAGQAVQNMNVMYGWDEREGLN